MTKSTKGIKWVRLLNSAYLYRNQILIYEANNFKKLLICM